MNTKNILGLESCLTKLIENYLKLIDNDYDLSKLVLKDIEIISSILRKEKYSE